MTRIVDRKEETGNGQAARLIRKTEQRQLRLDQDKGIEYSVNELRNIMEVKGTTVVVLVAGGSASGKTDYVSKRLQKAFGEDAIRISCDDYYKGTDFINANNLNFDHPNAVDLESLAQHLASLKSGSNISKPVYSFKTSSTSGYEEVKPAKVIIVEGLFALNEKILAMGDFKVFVDVDIHGAIIRRMMRDIHRSSWTLMENMRAVMNTAIPMYREHVEPTRKNADIVIENNYNPVTESARASSEERQVKYKAKVSQEQLLKLGAQRIASSKQTDYYYFGRDGHLRETGEVLRIRKEDDKILLAYKGPRKEMDPSHRHTFEFEVDIGIERGISELYGQSQQHVTKRRTTFMLNGLVVSVDNEVSRTKDGARTELGDFIEVKIPKHMDLDTVSDVMAKLGIWNESRVFGSYFEV